MFKAARLKPTSWFNILMDWKGSGNQAMLLSEFGMGMHQLSEELKVPLWESRDIYSLWDYISNYKYHDGSPHSPEQQTSASIQSRSQARANQTIKQVDISVAFKKYKLTSKKIQWLNNTATIVSKFNEYLTQGDISLRSFLINTLEDEKIKKITLDELDTILSILITDFNSACNAKAVNASTNNYNSDNYNRNNGDNDLFSGISDLSHSSSAQPGYMRFGIPKRKNDNTAKYNVDKKQPKTLPHIIPLHPHVQFQMRQQEKLQQEAEQKHIQRSSVPFKLPSISINTHTPFGAPSAATHSMSHSMSASFGTSLAPVSEEKHSGRRSGVALKPDSLKRLSAVNIALANKAQQSHANKSFRTPKHSRHNMLKQSRSFDEDDDYSSDSQYTYSEDDDEDRSQQSSLQAVTPKRRMSVFDIVP
eukprot:gene32440-40038_t